jgi:hypothetical protein
MLEGATFPNIEPFKPLTTKFMMLWYSSDMGKKWQSNIVFHTYYLQLKRAIEVVPHMMSNTLHWFKPLMKFRVDRHFIYITARVDKSKEEIHSYYKLIKEELEEITNEFLAELLIPVDRAKLSDPKQIGSSEATHEAHDTPRTS